MKKILIIRLSSFGDITQCASCLRPLKERFPGCEIDWIVREDMSSIVKAFEDVDRVISVPRSWGGKKLFGLGQELSTNDYEFVYDAHNNLRSHIICMGMNLSQTSFVRRKKFRFKRFLLFKLRKNTFPWPFKGAISYLRPLEALIDKYDKFFIRWNFSEEDKNVVDQHLKELEGQKILGIVPSTAWPMKSWPREHWLEFVKNYPGAMVIFGGPGDQFCEELEKKAKQALSLQGKLSLAQSAYGVFRCDAILSADTGLMHIADSMNKKQVSLIGPSAFGFPTNRNSYVAEVDLPCRPCSKDGSGSCSRQTYQECMVRILPKEVEEKIKQL